KRPAHLTAQVILGHDRAVDVGRDAARDEQQVAVANGVGREHRGDVGLDGGDVGHGAHSSLMNPNLTCSGSYWSRMRARRAHFSDGYARTLRSASTDRSASPA